MEDKIKEEKIYPILITIEGKSVGLEYKKGKIVLYKDGLSISKGAEILFVGLKKHIDFLLEEHLIAYKKKLLEEIEKLTHYYRSRQSPDCSRGENEKERSIEMIESEQVKSIITK